MEIVHLPSDTTKLKTKLATKLEDNCRLRTEGPKF